ncbi:hypothetical protein DY251_11475 [Mesorhizobium denitrificans]|uniref:Uncharacterized protein n=2 Tax=Phyllobacteriaceae TaxID=69277 RepID=A0A371XEJ8_9HYPH|nr:hypothetical protein DY251_11475 [Mesorhizobium denitrificans]
MKTRHIAPVLAAIFLGFALSGAQAATVPCEEMLKQLRAQEAATPPKPAYKTAFDDLKTKGIERCNADDDKRSDAFFAQAMDLLRK